MARKTLKRKAIRQRLHKRIRTRINGTSERPRLAVHFSGQHIRAQVIDDEKGVTIVSASTTDKDLLGKKLKPNVAGASEIGKLIGERAKDKKVSRLVFDRGGFNFHGKVKALADAARETGMEF